MTEEPWTCGRILAWIEGYLGNHGDENPRLSAQWLVSEALGVSRLTLYTDLDRPLTDEERTTLRDYTRRRGAGEPLQYITGEAPFRHIVVKVKPGVLIPRPETEVLVSEALGLLPQQEKPQDVLDAELIRRFKELNAESGQDEGVDEDETAETPDKGTARPLVADICTGTGCIACSIATEYPGSRIVATDIAPEAAALAEENACALGVADAINIICCDLGEGIDQTLFGAFDLIVSNPPYVPTSVLREVPHEVSDFEPALALDGGEDGLDIFRRLLAFSRSALKPGGAFAFELHETCLDEAAADAIDAGFEGVRITKDLTDRPRVLTGRKA